MDDIEDNEDDEVDDADVDRLLVVVIWFVVGLLALFM